MLLMELMMLMGQMLMVLMEQMLMDLVDKYRLNLIQGSSLNDRDGVIDYTPLKEVSHAWSSSEGDDEDSHNTSVNNQNAPAHGDSEDRGDVIDYTPLEEHSENWDAFLQKKLKHHKSKKHAHKK